MALDIVLIGGVSGSGKSVALGALEDSGYYTVNNLPLPMLPDLVRHLEMQGHPQIAVTIDPKSGDALKMLPDVIANLRALPADVRFIYLDAKVETLVKRFSETRRRHPMSTPARTLPEAIEVEHAQGGCDEAQRSVPRAHGPGRGPGAEGISDHPDGADGREAGGQGRLRGPDVLLLALTVVVDARRGADSPEIEAERGVAGLPADLRGSNDDRVVHVSPVERMGVAEDESAPGAGDEPQAPLQGRPGGDRHDDGFFLAHADPTLGGRRGIFKAPGASDPTRL